MDKVANPEYVDFIFDLDEHRIIVMYIPEPPFKEDVPER